MGQDFNTGGEEGVCVCVKRLCAKRGMCEGGGVEGVCVKVWKV